MPKFVHADVQTGGLTAFRNAAAKVLLIKNYTIGDSYATVVGNKLAEGNVVSSEITIAADGTGQKATLAGRNITATASAAAGSNLHVAVTDGAAKVLIVTDETTDQAITSGNSVGVPDVPVQAPQPT